MRSVLLLLCLASPLLLRGQAPTPAVAPAEPAPASPTAQDSAVKKIEHDGQIFELANSTIGQNVQTDEYILAGEKLADWTQLITVQRLSVAKTATAEGFVTYFRQKVESDGASLDVLTHNKAACVFAVRFPKSDRNDEQVMICLAFTDPTNAGTLNIVQYAIKPLRSPVSTTAAHIKSWRDRFLRQAQNVRTD